MYFSELFEWFRPHEKQLTGATGDRRNVGLADHGTIFLDEIGDLRMDHRKKLGASGQIILSSWATTATTVSHRVRLIATQKGVSEMVSRDLYSG